MPLDLRRIIVSALSVGLLTSGAATFWLNRVSRQAQQNMSAVTDQQMIENIRIQKLAEKQEPYTTSELVEIFRWAVKDADEWLLRALESSILKGELRALGPSRYSTAPTVEFIIPTNEYKEKEVLNVPDLLHRHLTRKFGDKIEIKVTEAEDHVLDPEELHENTTILKKTKFTLSNPNPTDLELLP